MDNPPSHIDTLHTLTAGIEDGVKQLTTNVSALQQAMQGKDEESLVAICADAKLVRSHLDMLNGRMVKMLENKKHSGTTPASGEGPHVSHFVGKTEACSAELAAVTGATSSAATPIVFKAFFTTKTTANNERSVARPRPLSDDDANVQQSFHPHTSNTDKKLPFASTSLCKSGAAVKLAPFAAKFDANTAAAAATSFAVAATKPAAFTPASSNTNSLAPNSMVGSITKATTAGGSAQQRSLFGNSSQNDHLFGNRTSAGKNGGLFTAWPFGGNTVGTTTTTTTTTKSKGRPTADLSETRFGRKATIKTVSPKTILKNVEKDTENLEPAIRSSVRALASTVQRMEREGKGPYDAPYSGLVDHPALGEEQQEEEGNDQQRTSLLILRQTALNLAIAAGRLDIVSLMVGPEDEGLGEFEDTEKQGEEVLCATHLGWNPCFTTTDSDTVLKAAKREYPVLSCFLSQKSVFGSNPVLPDGREPKLRLPATLAGWVHGSVTAITSLNALHRACFYNRLAIVRYLVETCGMCVDDPTLYGSSAARSVFSFFFPIHFAAVAATWTGDLSVLRYLIEERKCDKDARVFASSHAAENVKTADHLASPAQTALNLVCAFRESIKPPPQYMNEHERTRHATYSRLVVRYLLRAGLDSLAETKAGDIPFSLAINTAKRCAEEKFNGHYHAAIRANGGGNGFFANSNGSREEVKWSMALVKTLLSRYPWVCPLHRAYTREKNQYSSVVTLACPLRFTGESFLNPLPVDTVRELQGNQPTELLALLLSYGAVPLSAEESERLLYFISPRHCQLMLDHGIDLVGSAGFQSKEETTVVPVSALRTVVQSNRPDLIRLLLENGCDPNQEDPLTGRTALFTASSTEVVKALVSGGAKTEWRDRKGRTALHAIVANRGLECETAVSALVAAGCDLRASDGGRRAMTPLHVWAASVLGAKLLRVVMAISRVVCSGTGWQVTPSSSSSQTSLDGIGMNVRDAFGFSPLHVAALWSIESLKSLLGMPLLRSTEDCLDVEPPVVGLLINARTSAACDQWVLPDDDLGAPDDFDAEYFSNAAYADITSQQSSNGLSNARMFLSGKSMRELVASAELPVSQKPPIAAGSTPLHAAVSWGNLVSCLALLDRDACDPNITDANGNTPLHLAVLGGHAGIVGALLRSSKVDRGLRNGAASTAFDLAVAAHNANIQPSSDAWKRTAAMVELFDCASSPRPNSDESNKGVTNK